MKFTDARRAAGVLDVLGGPHLTTDATWVCVVELCPSKYMIGLNIRILIQMLHAIEVSVHCNYNDIKMWQSYMEIQAMV